MTKNKHQSESKKASSETQTKAQKPSPETEQTAQAQQAEEKAEAAETVNDAEKESDAVGKLQLQLQELQAKYDQLNDTYLRSRAEFENYRKRSLNEKAELIKNGGEKVLVNILPVIDDFERGLDALEKNADPAAVKEGMDLIYNKLQTFLKQNGVSEIDAIGKDFDTDLHEAVTMFPAPDESQKGKVIDCVQKGYYLNDKVIRYAKVVVGN